MKLHYGWVVVAVGALATCVGMGAMFSLPVFLTPIAADTGWSRAGIASAMTLNFLTMGVAAFGWGALSDRFGPRRVVLAGVVLLGIGLAWASRSTSLIEFQLAYGVIVGLAGGSFIAPLVATVTQWFDEHRAVAVSLVGAGNAVAPMTVSPLASWLIEAQGWRTAAVDHRRHRRGGADPGGAAGAPAAVDGRWRGAGCAGKPRAQDDGDARVAHAAVRGARD